MGGIQVKLIEPSVQLIDVPDLLEKIEIIGRTCYKSENKITQGSAKRFVDGLIQRSHFAMLEHAEVTYEITGIADSTLYQLLDIPFVRHSYVIKTSEMQNVHLVTVSLSHLFNPMWSDNEYIQIFKSMFLNSEGTFPVTTSFKNSTGTTTITLFKDILTELPRLSSMSDWSPRALWDHHGSYTLKFTCDRGVSHELVRHRCSFAQESTRYCNYTASKFGEEIKFIEPSSFDKWNEATQHEFIHQLESSESCYMYLISEQGLRPQEARAVLPNALKTEVIMTAPVYQWQHFFNLRSFGTTGIPHPDMKLVADQAYEIFNQQQSRIDSVLN